MLKRIMLFLLAACLPLAVYAAGLVGYGLGLRGSAGSVGSACSPGPVISEGFGGMNHSSKGEAGRRAPGA